MTQQQTYTTEQSLETAILVGVHAQTDEDFNFESTMEELSSLSQTCQLNVKAQFSQNRTNVDNKFYVGKGKLDEIKAYVEFHDIDVVVANDELTTAQSKTLNGNLNVKIIDRTQLILEIFALRARSKEGKLQVELAQLDYLMPRLQGHGRSLSRLGGGIGTRGPGETKLEMDRRHIRTRMNEIKHQLETVVEHRERYRNKREQNHVFQVALVGYTNAGKSSWFNALAKESTYEKKLLFATLDPKTRQIQINDGFNLIISDTVGFIQKLPTTLIAAFKSTLEEAKNADLLLHVVDSSHPEYRAQYDTVNQIVNDLDMGQIPQAIIFNKKDLHDGSLPATNKPHVFVSSKDEKDIEKVKSLLFNQIKQVLTYYEESVPSANADRLYFLKQHTLISELVFDEINANYQVKGYKKE
ncbi:GTPase HflX [Staphylococcus saprophyticus]|uniref:GTPase HflX n=1 Tax=Staphylococcus saprophyticus subsp. saprophyticus (strain ATCC 15305 / DSM 20229 / NCIMB 8711 / NCTC 7292 / S-41) TaxID=342451 RepID=Q49X99_STAS1|nr:GTPase HflX [Staphylococcus saprophyticus]ASF18285.2 GTPase HflX [Staphylococcus saprophyticus]MCT1650894.1 GTPase HflX [Staphylococcus saprophyticus]MDW3917935.1 GTPase HflX [Staphylococcus saprophyticus]OOC98434.1 GTPase HflX [Staphylococcus saprophyticus subsp. saprophyticus ATCC 15305 = NCTC 7292]QCY42675.1 GTPase HflX [Staphylococcus saprophyticus subsp. saprophyticus ATCC 15305 = NCTC 7292]